MFPDIDGVLILEATHGCRDLRARCREDIERLAKKLAAKIVHTPMCSCTSGSCSFLAGIMSVDSRFEEDLAASSNRTCIFCL